MTSLPWLLFPLAALSSLALAAMGLSDRRRDRLQWSFALGMLGFAVEALGSLALLTLSETPEDRRLWLSAAQAVSAWVLLPWAVFVATLYAPSDRATTRWRVTAGVGVSLALAAVALVAFGLAFDVSDVVGPFYAAQLTPVGVYTSIAEILVSVAILVGLEGCLLSSRHLSRWRIKHLVLGLGGIFLVRFFFLSQMILFKVVMGSYLTTSAATLLVGNVVIAGSLLRGRLAGTELTVSRTVLYRSVVAVLLGGYLVAVGALGWLLPRLGVSEDIFWWSLIVFVSALALAVFLLSENVRWRVKRFIALNFYRSRYDYRAQWITFTKRLGSLIALEDLAPELLAAVTETVGATRGALYLTRGHDDRFHLTAAVEAPRVESTLDADVDLVRRLHDEPDPILIASGRAPRPALPPMLAERLPDGSVAVPLRWRGALTGIMLLGPERGAAPYTVEDLEFLATVAEQAAGVLAGARLSEAVAQAREFEAFHRLTSFVIHDLKNAISALSLLSDNALANFDDREFQQDAIKTLSRTVERMKRLLSRLAAAPESAPVRVQSVDLRALAEEATAHVGGTARITLERDLRPVGPVSGDDEALLRVIQNLVTNAIEALDGAGTVTVRTHEEPPWVVVSVTDTGCGIPEEFLRESLFAPFKSTKKGGWGVGLYQARATVEAHRGAIGVASRVGEGTTVSVRLPRAGTPEAPASP